MVRVEVVLVAIHATSASVPIRQALPSLARLTGSTADGMAASGLAGGPGKGAGCGSSAGMPPD
jgi:hypothetical protein